MLRGWSESVASLEGFVNEHRDKCLKVYKEDINRVEEDAGKERGIAEGGYGRKQIQELIQNAADALQGAPGRAQVTLTEDALYVANEGLPFDERGLRALLYTHLSSKTGTEIGRFGLGFKSISGISDNPQVFSRTVSFEFSRDRSATTLTEELGRHFDPESIPALRLAWLLNPTTEFRADPALAELARWATTVVKVPLKPGAGKQLSEEIDEFDESFNLFAPHVRALDLVNGPGGTERHFKAAKKGNRITLTTADGSREWLVVSTDHKPSQQALESAGHAARRETVTVSWALPLTGAVGVGQLSAFFPVKSQVTLSGRLNAPWKLSDDRINVIECAFNHEILADVAPHLVASARKDLIADGAYGRYIDVLPARGRELRSWADGVLNEPIFKALREKRCLPDLDGQLRTSSVVRRIPELTTDLSARWLEVAGNRSEWVHPDCTTSPERRSKVDRLMQDSDRPRATQGRVLHWLQSVVADPNATQSAAAIELAADLAGQLASNREQNARNAEHHLRDSRIVLLENGTMAQPIRGRCFLRTSADQSGSSFVDPAVAGRPSTTRALEELGITPFDDGGEMLELLTQLRRTGQVDWDALWMAMRGSDIQQVQDAFDGILEGHAAEIVRVRNGHGSWVLPAGLYVAGDCLRQLKEDGDYLVDGNYHAADQIVLHLLGLRSRPSRSPRHSDEKWVSRFRNAVRNSVGDDLKLSTAARENIIIETIDNVYGPLECLPNLSVTNRVLLTAAVINEVEVPRVRVSHPSVSRSELRVAPEIWWIREAGLVQTALGPMPVNAAFVAEVPELPEGLVPSVTDVTLSSQTEVALGLKKTIAELDEAGFHSLVETHVRRDDVERVGQSYAWWCWTLQTGTPPKHLRVHHSGQWTDELRTKVAVAQGMDKYRELEEFGIPCVVVGAAEDVHTLSELWGCLQGRDLPVTYSYESSAEPELLIDVFPVLKVLDIEDDLEDLMLQKCLSLSKVAAVPGQPEMRVECVSGAEGNRILVTGGTEAAILKQILGQLNCDDSDRQVAILLENMQRKRNSAQVQKIRAAKSDAERLLILAGEDRLRSLIPKAALTYLEKEGKIEPHGIDLAHLCITMHGSRALERVCRMAGDDLPDGVPSMWTGSFNTRSWVKSLGFGEQWGGRRGAPRNKPTEYVDGPTQLDSLHDYQRQVSQRLKNLLAGRGPRRGIVSLPTGAGKTRVTVQSVIECIRDGQLDGSAEAPFAGPILWLADGEELCEQAIDTWSYLWRAVGRQETPLILSRFWSNYETAEESGGVQVVVATWQKINQRAVDQTSFEWLAAAPIVIIDEAHGAYTPSYTRILDWLGRGHLQREKPMIGLTATPFRGRRDSDETQLLLKRFDNNRLDEGVFGDEHPQLRLQRDRVLAHARLEIIDGISIDLTDTELNEFRTNGWLSSSAASRLGRNEDRTRTIVESILKKPSNWQIVVFAASVENAQTLATLLTLAGRSAASIDQDTSPEDRRASIERFKSGDLKVLTNYAVLSQGFDAPKTDAVYITRPTSSEVRYQQMVGRGLRGPKNGGTEEVLIVNMLDNIVEFGDSIVFQSMQEIIDSESRAADDDMIEAAGGLR